MEQSEKKEESEGAVVGEGTRQARLKHEAEQGQGRAHG
jgi:hypothetical protein